MPASRPSSIVLAVDVAVDRGELALLCPSLRLVLTHTGATTVICDLSAARANLEVVEALARLRLAVGRRGVSLCLRHASRELLDLLELTGLGQVLAVEPRGQAEEGEDRLGVQEERELGDPTA